jgi:two-component system OmpR family response regulator
MTGKLAVLFVDDDDGVRDVAELSLELDENITVRVAESGRAAIALLLGGDWRPDVILLDVMMPDMDGPAVLGELRRYPQFAGIPVIFVTGRAGMAEGAAYAELGAIGLVAKPFQPIALAPEIRRILAQPSG